MTDNVVKTDKTQDSSGDPPESADRVIMVPIKTNEEFLTQTLGPVRKHGDSQVERVARTIEERRANRIQIPFEVRAHFLEVCGEIAEKAGYSNRMPLADFKKMKKDIKKNLKSKPKQSPGVRFFTQNILGIYDLDHSMLELLNHAQINIDKAQAQWFWFRDFNFYFTEVVPKRRWLRNPTVHALQSLFLFYLISAVLFCSIMDDENVCPRDPTSLNREWYGWMSSIYFASVTMSTVGYGDISFAGQEAWREFIGALYMIVSVLVGFTILATAADAAVSGMSSGKGLEKAAEAFQQSMRKYQPNTKEVPLYKQVRIICAIRLMELAFLFIVFNVVGMLIARIFIKNSVEPDEQWSWMTTFYWSVQTTTTIGYGDLSMPFSLRWFQIFYTTLGTALVGSVFGGVANLRSDLADLRRTFAWRRLEVSKRLVEDLNGWEAHDGKISEYEFVVGSLLLLQKINQDDVGIIMDKFRDLAGDNEYILYNEDDSGIFEKEGSDHDEENKPTNWDESYQQEIETMAVAI